MPLVRDDLATTLLVDLSRVGLDLARARERLRYKDTPAHRAAVAACREQADALLDMYRAATAVPVPAPA